VTDPAPGRLDATGPQVAAPSWQAATVVEVRAETVTARTLRLRLERPVVHVPGQHVVVRLTAEDGYTASRSYSVASAPDATGEIELTVELLPDGEVSPFIHEVVEVGDVLEIRGPLGRWFTWRGEGPALLVGGGSGIVPLMSMVRWARASGRAELLRVVVSVRTPADLYYADELVGPEVTVVHTRRTPDDDRRPPGHLTAAEMGPVGRDSTVYLCGSGGFVEHASGLLLGLGVEPARIRVERFGPS